MKNFVIKTLSFSLFYTAFSFSSASAEDIFILNSSNQIIRFDTAAPSTPLNTATLTGLVTGDTLVDIDFRPSSGFLIGVGSLSNLYRINPMTGAATKLGSFAGDLIGAIAATDISAADGTIRIESVTGENIRINIDDASIATSGTALSFSVEDPNTGSTPSVSGLAYSDDFAGTNGATLYGLEKTKGVLVRQGSLDGSPVTPDAGSFFTIGSLGVGISGTAGFDISASTGSAYAAFVPTGQSAPELFSINLQSGQATSIGQLQITGTVRGVALPTLPANVLATIASTTLAFVNADAPSLSFGKSSVTGLQNSESLLNIDYRPATGELYALGSTSRLYKVDPATGIATEVGSSPFSPVLSGTTFGMDFNPAVDNIRIVSGSNSNFTLDPTTGAVTSSDSPVLYDALDVHFAFTPHPVSIAYSDTAAGGAATAYVIDAVAGTLTTLGSVGGSPVSAASGHLFTIGTLPFSTPASGVGFDIMPGEGIGFIKSGTSLYEVNPTTAKAIFLGTLTSIPSPTDIAAAPSAIISVSSSTASGTEGAKAMITIDRARNLSGTVLVPYQTVAGTATANVNYTPESGVLTFVDGESSKAVPLPILDDSIPDTNKSFTFQLLSPVGGVLGAQSSAVVSVIDSIDSDGDGFSNKVEALFGTNPLDAHSTPFGGAGPGAAKAVSSPAISLAVNFQKSNSDTLTFSGRVALPSNFKPSREKIVFEINNQTAVGFTLGSNGTGKSGSSSVRVSRSGSAYAISLSITKASLQKALGITQTTANRSKISIPVSIYLDGRFFQRTFRATYSAPVANIGTARG